MTTLSERQITGRERSHVIQIDEPVQFAAMPEVAEAFMDMRSAAQKDGIDMEPFSSFRNFKTQLRIWNHKYTGKKPFYDRDGNIMSREGMTQDDLIWHILDWSALPGGSRHQWGTEIDVIDRSKIPKDYRVKLLPEEIQDGGVFSELHNWLNNNMKNYGFFRPYARYIGGMNPEPWHLSYAPVSQKLIKQISPELLIEVISETENIEAKERTIELIPEIFEKHIKRIVGPDDQ